MRSNRTSRSLTFVSTLLLTTALAAPAFAQIEEVVVTAQKKSEDIQTVPIAVTAFTSSDLAAHQITKFDDLQFATPNVTYSQANFGGANFQIRGIGVTAVGGGSESGVAVNFNDVFLAAPPTDGASFYDLQDIEVLRGPQSTLYGRGATGGAVNIMPARPDLETFSTQVDGQYGNYNGYEVKGDVNMPIITDQLAVRVAGDVIGHDGFTKNIADNFDQNDRYQYSFRGSVRWEPTSSTTIDVVGQFSREQDARARADKELCNPDPTGTLGCTPAAPTTGALNLNATYLNILASKQGYEGLLAPGIANLTLGIANGFLNPAGQAELAAFESAAGLSPGSPGGGNIPALLAALPTDPAHAGSTGLIRAAYNGTGLFSGFGYNGGQAFGSALGLTDTSMPFVAPANSNPSDLREVNDDFNPVNRQQDNFMSIEVKQKVADWLDATLVGGYDHASYFNQQSYTNTFGPPLGAENVAVAESTFLNSVVGNPVFGGNAALAAIYAPYFPAPCQVAPGDQSNCTLPVSNPRNFGVGSGSVNRVSANLSSNDQSDGAASQYSGELRFASKFEGPVNFMIGGYYLHQDSRTDYYVASNSLDYAGILAGGLDSIISTNPAVIAMCTSGCLDGPSYYHNEGRDIDLTSKAIFGEVYYDILPDLLKLTLGGRYTDDQKSEDSRIAVLSGAVPLGASNEDAVLAQEAQNCIITDPNTGVCGFDPNKPNQAFISQSVEFKKVTGRAVLDWTPKLDFTDQTLVYASYARGYKAGGFNPGVQAGLTLPLTYAPEFIDAYELGTKNILADGHLQANADVWYYNYSGLQVSAIIDNTSINENINAKLYGVEGELVWLPTDNLQININIAATHSGVENTSEVDARDPTGGDSRAILIKDNSLTSSANQNCVIYDLNPGHATPQLPTGYTFVPSSVGPQTAIFEAPPGGVNALASEGIAAAGFGSCSNSTQLQTFLASQGYYETQDNSKLPGGVVNPYANIKGSTFTGVPKSLNGNELQQTPNLTVSVGAQYTFNLDGGYTLVPRVDYYWQGHTWGRIFHDPADFIKAWDVMNGQITLNSPDKNWYVGAFIKNAFDKTYVTGEYVTSASSGLYTNAFLGDPRTYGITAGVHF